eukprot:GCRY01000761.1.p1 GENE.GCRY01000761.1~~GCRY01000761.1.p1  ORF type:complete len:322 (+),score=75.53 GCRY01000761.1:181-1146(+)
MKTNPEIVEEYLRFIHGPFESLTASKISDYLDPNFTHHIEKGEFSAKDTLIHMKQWSKNIPTEKLDIKTIISEDEMVFVYFEVTYMPNEGTKYPGTDVDISGKRATVEALSLFSLKDGQITEQVSRYDNARVLKWNLPPQNRHLSQLPRAPVHHHDYVEASVQAAEEMHLVEKFLHQLHKPGATEESLQGFVAPDFYDEAQTGKNSLSLLLERAYEWHMMVPVTTLVVHAIICEGERVGVHYSLYGKTKTGAKFLGEDVSDREVQLQHLSLFNLKRGTILNSVTREDDLRCALGVDCHVSDVKAKMMGESIDMKAKAFGLY